MNENQHEQIAAALAAYAEGITAAHAPLCETAVEFFSTPTEEQDRETFAAAFAEYEKAITSAGSELETALEAAIAA